MSEHREALNRLIDAGLSFAEITLAYAARRTDEERALVHSAINTRHAEGDLEVDEHAIVSPNDENKRQGYVMAWIWVDLDNTADL
jgi:hypothetical protein